jgi:hypothetical protein
MSQSAWRIQIGNWDNPHGIPVYSFCAVCVKRRMPMYRAQKENADIKQPDFNPPGPSLIATSVSNWLTLGISKDYRLCQLSLSSSTPYFDSKLSEGNWRCSHLGLQCRPGGASRLNLPQMLCQKVSYLSGRFPYSRILSYTCLWNVSYMCNLGCAMSSHMSSPAILNSYVTEVLYLLDKGLCILSNEITCVHFCEG